MSGCRRKQPQARSARGTQASWPPRRTAGARCLYTASTRTARRCHAGPAASDASTCARRTAGRVGVRPGLEELLGSRGISPGGEGGRTREWAPRIPSGRRETLNVLRVRGLGVWPRVVNAGACWRRQGRSEEGRAYGV